MTTVTLFFVLWLAQVDTVQALFKQYQHNPPVSKNQPPVAGAIAWERSLFHRIKHTIIRFQSMEDMLTSEYGKAVSILTLCSPSSTIGTAACSPSSTFGTDNGAMQNELLHLWTQWHCLELSVNIHWVPIVSYSGELPALSLILIFQLGYLGLLKNNMAFTGFSTKWVKS